MLAVMTVTDLRDDTLANLAGDGQLSLREAVEAISIGADVDGIGPTSGAYGADDRIEFSPSLFDSGPQTLPLAAGQLELDRSAILMGPGQDLLTLDGRQNSRVLQISSSSGDVTVAALTLTGGATVGDNPDEFTSTYSGGAIRSLTPGNLTIDRSTISGNSTGGSYASGGGVFALGNLTLSGSTIRNNSTSGDSAYGGGLFALADAILTSSTVSGNQTAGSTADGGGLLAFGDVVVASSTLSGNRTTGGYADGGGIYAFAEVTLIQSTISGNHTDGNQSQGGGIYAPHGITLVQSTITGNRALDTNAKGGGVWSAFGPLVLDGSIVAANTVGGNAWDLQLGAGTISSQYSLIGDNRGTTLAEAQVPDSNGNLIGSQAGSGAIDPVLGPLADHGGPTFTHDLLSGSPALNGGDPAFDPNAWTPALDFDQRGAPFARVTFGQIDLGAQELDTGSAEISADFDADADVDGNDFLAWQRGLGTQSGASGADGDATGDGAVRGGDLAAWQSTFGEADFSGEVSLLSSQALQAEVSVVSALDPAGWYVPPFPPMEGIAWSDAQDAATSPLLLASDHSEGWLERGLIGQHYFPRSSVSPRPRTAGQSPARVLPETHRHGNSLQRTAAISGRRRIAHEITDTLFAQFGEA